jgi:hypothetical protein
VTGPDNHSPLAGLDVDTAIRFRWALRDINGGDLTPSPSITDAILGGRELLEVRCKRCGHEDRVDLALVVWPREKPVHSLGKALECRPCKRDGRPKQRPDLVALVGRPQDDPAAPAGALWVGQ